MRAIITGACGFVGSYLATHLRQCGDEVLGTVAPARADDVFPFRTAVVDITDAEPLARLFADFHPDVVYHLAGISFVPDAEADFNNALKVNVGGVHNILRVCHTLQSDIRVVLVSSGEVYGKVAKSQLPLTEESPLAPVNSYSVTKLMSEIVAERFSRLGCVHTVIMRPFNHIGPGQGQRFVTSSFAWQLAHIARGKAEPVIRVGNLEARRDFSDVRDIVRAYRLGAEKGEGVYNLGSGQAVSIQTILELLIKISQVEVRIESDPARMRPSEVPEVYTSYARAERELGWRPEVQLEQTLNDIYQDWYDRIG